MQQMSLNEAATLCDNINQPIRIPANNKSFYVINETIYNEYLQLKEAEEVLKGFDEIERGEYVDGKTFFKEMREKYGL